MVPRIAPRETPSRTRASRSASRAPSDGGTRSVTLTWRWLTDRSSHAKEPAGPSRVAVPNPVMLRMAFPRPSPLLRGLRRVLLLAAPVLHGLDLDRRLLALHPLRHGAV